MSYDLLIFDADETLFDFKKTERVAMSKTFERLGMDYDESYHLPIYKEINHQAWVDFEEGLIKQNEIDQRRIGGFIDTCQLKTETNQMISEYLKALGEGSYLFDGAKELITHLNSNHRLAIITNGLWDVQKERICKSEIAHLFEGIIVSDKVGVAKPNKKIFELLYEELEIKHDIKALMIGDSLKSDIAGGINFGIDTCWVNFQGKDKSDVSPTYEIKDMNEMEVLLKSFSK